MGGVAIVIEIISSSKAGGILHPLRLELQALVGLIMNMGVVRREFLEGGF